MVENLSQTLSFNFLRLGCHKLVPYRTYVMLSGFVMSQLLYWIALHFTDCEVGTFRIFTNRLKK
jgi:hypothetical protein